MKRPIIFGRRGMARYLTEAERRHQAHVDRLDEQWTKDLEEYARVATSLRLQLSSARSEIERCRRNHNDLGARNGRLQADNVRLAQKLERSELLREQAEDHLARLTAGGAG